MNTDIDTRIKAYLAAWSSSLALLLSQLTAEAWQAEDAVADPGYQANFSIRISTSGDAGQQWASFRASDLAVLLGIFLGEEVHLGESLDDMQREAVEELLRQWCGLAATALKAEFGERSFAVAVEPQVRSAGAAPTMRLLRASGGERSIELLLDLHHALPEVFVEEAPRPLSAPAARPQAAGRVEELMRQGNLELLMDVELGVMLRFGCREATLREVLDMATGAVLELDREIQEPVDLVLNGKIIARGEVVVIDGNYGLRVSEVASPQQRVSSL